MNIKNVSLWIIVLLAIYYGGRLMFGTGGGLDTANLAQGLFIATEARMLTNEYWAITGELPCKAGELDIRITSDYGPSVLAAVDVAGCGQIANIITAIGHLKDRHVRGRKFE